MTDGSDRDASPRRPRLGLLHWIGILFLGAVLVNVIRGAWPKGPDYGPTDAMERVVTTAPGIGVELLAGDESLASARFTAFDVSPTGVVLVRDARRFVDLASGQSVLERETPLASFAFAGGGLVASTAEGDIGAVVDAELGRATGSPPHRGRLVGASDGSRLLVLRDGYDAEGDSPAILSLRPDTAPEAATGSFAPVDAAAADTARIVYSVGNALFQVVAAGEPGLLLVMPGASDTILGAAIDGDATFFSTNRVVYALDEGIAVPLATEIGGELRVAAGALYVLDATAHRVYRILLRGSSRP